MCEAVFGWCCRRRQSQRTRNSSRGGNGDGPLASPGSSPSMAHHKLAQHAHVTISLEPIIGVNVYYYRNVPKTRFTTTEPSNVHFPSQALGVAPTCLARGPPPPLTRHSAPSQSRARPRS